MNDAASRHAPPRLRASLQDGTYPRPQLVRPHWVDLCGPWEYRSDDDDRGVEERWSSGPAFDRTIVVPFPPESPSSGIGDTGFHPVVWYRRVISEEELEPAGMAEGRTILHFGAVDYAANVWLNGVHLGSHEGGHTPFSFEITEALLAPVVSDGHVLVVRASDDPADVAQPRGKQDWRLEPHDVWYHRTTGIWQPVWVERVPAQFVDSVHWVADSSSQSILGQVRLSQTPRPGSTLEIEVSYEDHALGSVRVPAARRDVEALVAIPVQANGQSYEKLLWSPEHPRLLDVIVTLESPETDRDVVASYLGLRSAAVAGGRFNLNDRPYYVRSVLNQGYWPESHLASPSAAALRREVELIKELGFNATRVHQKIEDPRLLYWADRLGVLVWGEAPSAFEFSPQAMRRMTDEWIATLERDRSHPSIVTWVPFNESWGVQHIAADARMQAYVRALVQITRAFDPSRPVVSNDGWEHVDSDIITVHDYEWSADVVAARYRDEPARAKLLTGAGPAGRPVVLPGQELADCPVMLTEFGGISLAADTVPHAWGYSTVSSAEDLDDRLSGLLTAVHRSEFLAGFCYTQLADTVQETNGLLTADRKPKLPIERLRALVSGTRTR